jgi:hypothetical protein
MIESSIGCEWQVYDAARKLLEQVIRELTVLDGRQLPDRKPEGIRNINWLSREDVQREYGGSYDRYLRT